MKRLLIPTLAVYTVLGLLGGGLLLFKIYNNAFPNVADQGALFLVGALALSPIFALLVAALGPQRPEGLLKLEDPFDTEAKTRAKSRLRTFLRVLGLTFGAGLLAALSEPLLRHHSPLGGILLAGAGCLMVLLAPWIALYARWFRINWF